MEERAIIFDIQNYSIHDGPGIRTVVFFKGCPARCAWCSNPESQSGQPEPMWDEKRQRMKLVGQRMTYDEVLQQVLKDRPFYEESGGGVTLSGGDPLFQAAFATELAKKLQALGIHTACETTGYAKPAVFSAFLQSIDYVFLDVKHYDEAKHFAEVGIPLAPILQNLKHAVDTHPDLHPRIPVIPGFNETLEDARGFAALFQSLGVREVELLPFHQFGEKKYEDLQRPYTLQGVKQLHKEDLLDYQSLLIENGIHCILQ